MKTKTLLAMAAALAASVASASAAEVELKLSSMFPPGHFVHTLIMNPWAEALAEKTGGRVNVTLSAAGSALGDATRQFDQARAGVVDLAIGIPGIPRGRHPRTALVELPFVVPDSGVATCALMAAVDDLAPDFPGTKVIYLTSTEPSAVHLNREAKGLEDLSGLRVRTPGPAITSLLEHYGATPVGLPPTQIYENAERKVIDGNVMPWGPVGAFKLYEVFDTHIDAKINPVGMYMVMNQAKYDSLPDDIKAAFEETNAEWFTPANWGKWWSDTDQTAIDAAKERGNTIVEIDEETRGKWREDLSGAIDAYLANESDMDADEARRIYGRLGEAVAGCQ